MFKRAFLAALAALFLVLAGPTSAAQICGINLSEITSPIDARPPSLDAYAGASTMLLKTEGRCQVAQIIGGITVSPEDGFTEILLAVLVNDHGQKKSELEYLAVQKDRAGKSYVNANWGFCHPLRIIFELDGSLGSTCNSTEQFASVGSGGGP